MRIDNWKDLLEVATREFRDEVILTRYKASMWERNQHRYPQYDLSDSDLCRDPFTRNDLKHETDSKAYYAEMKKHLPGISAEDFISPSARIAAEGITAAPLAAEGGNSGSSGSSGSSVKGETIYSGYNEADIPGTARKGEN